MLIGLSSNAQSHNTIHMAYATEFPIRLINYYLHIKCGILHGMQLAETACKP